MSYVVSKKVAAESSQIP